MGEVSTRLGSTPRRVMYDRLYRPGSRKGIIWCSGLSGTADHLATVGDDTLSVTRALTGTGFAVAMRDSGTLWGNSTSRTNTGNLKTHTQTTTGIFASGKVHLLGVSMGSVCALNYAKNNPTLVQSILCILPAVDIQDIHTNNRGGHAATIAAAHGGGAPADADNPADNAATFASSGIPIKLYYSTNDDICIASNVTTFASAVGSTATAVSMGAIGHTILSSIPRTDFAAFFSNND